MNTTVDPKPSAEPPSARLRQSATDPQDSSPYGRLSLAVARQLYRKSDFSGVMVHLYIGARRGLKNGRWQFNGPDMCAQLGIDRRIVAKHLKRLAIENVLIPDGTTPKGAAKYLIDQERYEALYVSNCNECASDACAWDEHSSQLGRASNEHSLQLHVHSMPPPCASDEHDDVHPMTPSCTSNAHPGVHPMHTKNNKKNNTAIP